MSVTTLMTLTDLRDAAAEALAPITDDDPNVLVDVVDSLTPPALMLIWGDPWLDPGPRPGARTMGPCAWNARLQVLAVAGRLEPGPGIRMLEQLVGYVVDRMKADPYDWPLDSVSGPRVIDIGNLAWLGARVTYLVPTTV
jgi:hypothetical protein